MEGLNVVGLKPQDLTWEQAYRLFSLRCKSQNLAQTTQALYAEHLGLFKRWLAANGKPSPAEIQANHLRAYLNDYQTRGSSDLTVDCAYRILRTLWRFLLRDGLIILDPMEKVERPRRERRFVKPITGDQFRMILAQINTRNILGLRDYALLIFLADTGLRISEALSLKLSDIEWSANAATVLGKGRKERRIAFGQTARKALISWFHKRGDIPDSPWLWINRFGQQFKTPAFRKRMKEYTQAAGIAANRLSPHALRHFFALAFLKNGGDVMSLQKLLGHSSLHMVRNYVNMTDDDALTKHRQASPLDKLGPLPGERKQVRLG